MAESENNVHSKKPVCSTRSFANRCPEHFHKSWVHFPPPLQYQKSPVEKRQLKNQGLCQSTPDPHRNANVFTPLPCIQIHNISLCHHHLLLNYGCHFRNSCYLNQDSAIPVHTNNLIYTVLRSQTFVPSQPKRLLSQNAVSFSLAVVMLSNSSRQC